MQCNQIQFHSIQTRHSKEGAISKEKKNKTEKEREFFQLQLKSRRDKHTHRSRISRVRLALREEGRFTFDDIYILFTQRYRFIYFTDNLTANRLPTHFFNLFLMLYTLCR